MLLRVQAGPYTIRGVSVGGLYTSLQVPELGVLLDVGIAPRSCTGAQHLLVTHGHADHLGALFTLLGARGLNRLPPVRLYVPSDTLEDVTAALEALGHLQGYRLGVDPIAVAPGSEFELRQDLAVRALAADHVVPTLAYQFFKRVKKLRPEYAHLPGAEIGRRRLAGDDLFDEVEHLELAYVTDTLLSVVEQHPSLLRTRVLILECTFLDDRKTIESSRRSKHVHLDELIEKASLFENEALVLVHFSQLYSPAEVHSILRRRCPPGLWERVVVFAPQRGSWPG
jgi:ribonuclease Z